jgi:hypothetical protein
VLPAGLQRLRLSDAGACSAATLRALSDQPSTLTNLALDYHPLPVGEEGKQSAGMVTTANSNQSLIKREVQRCWAGLPALRSLHIGSRKVPLKYDLDRDVQHWMHGFPQVPETPQRDYILVNSSLLDSIAALTGLTSLTLGPSAWLQEAPEGSGLWGLSRMLSRLTRLQWLVLNMQVSQLSVQ